MLLLQLRVMLYLLLSAIMVAIVGHSMVLSVYELLCGVIIIAV